MIVPLLTIKIDLQDTAEELERLAEHMAGHLSYTQHRRSQATIDEIADNIEGIESSVERLRAAALKL